MFPLVQLVMFEFNPELSAFLNENPVSVVLSASGFPTGPSFLEHAAITNVMANKINRCFKLKFMIVIFGHILYCRKTGTKLK